MVIYTYTKEKLQGVRRMKKILSILFAFGIIFSLIFGFSVSSQAAGIEKTVDGTVTKITYVQSNGTEEIRIYTSKTNILRQFILPPSSDCKNYRLGVEISDAGITKNGSLDVNQGSVVQIRYADKSDPQAASIVVETKIKPQYSLTPASDGKSLILKLSGGVSSAPSTTPSQTPKPSATPTPSPMPVNDTTGQNQSSGTVGKNGPLSISMDGNTGVVKFDGINLNSIYGSTGKTPNIEYRETEKILQISLPGKDARYSDGILTGNSVIHGILVNYNVKMDCTLIRISWETPITYSQELSGGSSIIKIKLPGGVTGSTGATPSPTPRPSPTPTPKPSSTPTPSPTPTPDTSRGDTDRPTAISVAYALDSISISTPDINAYKVYRLGNPSRIVIEVPGTVSADQKTMPSGYLYQKATLSQSTGTTAQIVLDTSDLPEWTVSNNAGKLIVKLVSSGTTNIQGGDSNTGIALRLTGSNIVSKFRQYSGNILAEDDPKSNTFAFLLPSDLVNLGQGSAKINNSMVNSINTLTTENSTFLQLVKNDAAKLFKIVEGSNSNELLIVAGDSNTGGNAAIPKGKLVVLDAGHGGSDPGADIGGYYEKNFNLDITLKAEAILMQKGINVVLTRRSDVFVDLDQRCAIANAQKADLFVSIHNNAMPSSTTKGSMAFYYPTSYKGKAYARIFLDNLSKGLNMGSMGSEGLKSAEFVVLKKTLMPAALVEVACMTNNSDLSLLATDTFRQNAAENLANSIIQILNTMN